MSLVWRKLQRSRRKAAKFRFTARLEELSLRCSETWQPSKLCVAWVHRRRRVATRPQRWEPTIGDPQRGLTVFSDALEVTTTLYRAADGEAFDDKHWTLVVEAASTNGRLRAVAAVELNLRLFVHESPLAHTELKLKLRPLRPDVRECVLNLLLSCQIVKEGDALDSDLCSVASSLSQREWANEQQLTEKSPEHNEKVVEEIAELVSDLDKWQANREQCSDDAAASNRSHRDAPLPEAAATASVLIDQDSPIKDSPPSPEDSPFVPLRRPLHSFENDVEASFSGGAPVQTSTPKILSNDSGIGQEFKSSICTTTTATTGAVGSGGAPSAESSEDLLAWCQRTTRPYRGVKLANFSSSWRNGVAFCALLHAHRPELLDWARVRPADIRANCQLAFDAAATLGVPRLLDADDMLIMAIPDKIGVMTYVHSLRAALTGRPASSAANADAAAAAAADAHLRHSILSLSELDSRVLAEFERLKQERDLAAADRDESSLPPLSQGDQGHVEESPRRPEPDIPQAEPMRPPADLMKRNELMNPFDSDDDDNDVTASPPDETDSWTAVAADSELVAESATTEQRSASEAPVLRSSLSLGLPAISEGGGTSRLDELRRRAQQLLSEGVDSATTEKGSESPNEEETQRRRQLQQRARQLIADARADGVVRMSDALPPTQHRSAPATAAVSPDSNSVSPNAEEGASSSLARTNSLRRLASPQIAFYKFRGRVVENSGDATTRSLERPGIPALGSSRERIDFQSSAMPASLGAKLDRFKRFGSMRKQELTDSLSILQARFSHTVRSASLPKDISSLTAQIGSPQQEHKPAQAVHSACAQPDESESGRHKVASVWEEQLASSDRLTADMAALAEESNALDARAVALERRLRLVASEAPGSEDEQRLMNDYLGLLDERNGLVRREQQLNILQSISDYERSAVDLQRQVAQLINVDETEKTEAHKRQIDALMQDLIDIVNKKDELVQQLMAHEAEGDGGADEEGPIRRSVAEQLQDDKNCVIQ